MTTQPRANKPKTVPIPLRLSEMLLELADLHSAENRINRTDTLRQWMYQAAEQYAVSLVSEGRLSIGKAAELLNLTYYDIYRIAEKHSMTLGAE